LRTGVVLPTFTNEPTQALAVTRLAADVGIDAVFCYDHLWPMGRPDRPALAPFPLLAMLAATPGTEQLSFGTLVARVGLVPDDRLVAEFLTLEALAPGRVVAGLGTGDRLSSAENEAYGIAFDGVDERRRSLEDCGAALRAREIPVWIGGGSPATLAVAEALGAVVNFWSAPIDVVARQATRTEVTWAGPAPMESEPSGGAARLRLLVQEMAQAGASWIVLGWPAPLEVLAEAAAAW
jgi:alkanesulfonate monooxygenase SsuD/methylene tetrahydromethanopterin reductase-like flavin-dependent oxidoreductase (luciferase family)